MAGERVELSLGEVCDVKQGRYLGPGNMPEVKTEQTPIPVIGANGITHLLKGHLVLGVLRRVFLRATAKEGGTNVSIPNDALTQILADMVWRRCQSGDHKLLKRAVRAKTRKLMSRYPAAPQPVVLAV